MFFLSLCYDFEKSGGGDFLSKKFDHGGDVFSSAVELDFSVNLNPLGLPEAVRRALAENVQNFGAYPDPLCRRLREKLAKFLDLPSDYFVFGAGAADLIVRIALATWPKKVLVTAPTFSEYGRASRMVGAEISEFPLREEDGFALNENIFSALASRPDVFFLCNPNNPTGTLTAPGMVCEIADFCEARGILLVLDECFLAFTEGTSARELLATHRHTVVLDAFTKIFALAGLRLGYAMTADPALAERLASFAQSWPVSSPALVAGEASLPVAREWIARTREFVRGENEFLRTGLRDLGLKVFDGAANFTLFKCPVPLFDALLDRGILIRSCENFSGLNENFYRVCVKSRPENERLLLALREILTKGRAI